MAHHRRGRPKNRRAGCLMCKAGKEYAKVWRTRRERQALRDEARS